MSALHHGRVEVTTQQRTEDEPVAVGRTENGGVAFYNPATQTGIRALTGKDSPR